MQISISGRHNMKLTPALKAYVEQKFTKLIKHFDHVNNIHVVLSLATPYCPHVEARVEINQATLFAKSELKDMYAAIDELSTKLDRQIKRQKEKRRDQHKHVGTPPMPLSPDALDPFFALPFDNKSVH